MNKKAFLIMFMLQKINLFI